MILVQSKPRMFFFLLILIICKYRKYQKLIRSICFVNLRNIFFRDVDEFVAVLNFIESKSSVNPKDVALAKRKEQKKKGLIKSTEKKKKGQ